MSYSRHLRHGGASYRPSRFARLWACFLVRWGGPGFAGGVASRLAALGYPPHIGQVPLAYLSPRGSIDAHAIIYHSQLQLGAHVYIAPRVLIFQHAGGGAVSLGEKVAIHRDARLETGQGGSIRVEPGSSIHPGCQLLSFIAPIVVGEGVMIAANAALYSYDHGMAPDMPIRQQPLGSKGPITIGDDAWIGTGAIILSGVTIGKGAVVAAGSVVTRDIPDNAIAAGNPARVIKFRSELQQTVGIDE
jgi:acetyltransferase-like isoleucine patch superfamily enzyme